MEFLPGTNIACILYNDLVPAFISRDKYDNDKKRGKIKVHGRGGRNNTPLIEVRSLTVEVQQEIYKKLGHPEEIKRVKPFADRIVTDISASMYYTEYRMNNGAALPKDRISSYTMAASVLNLLVQLTDHPQVIKKDMGLTMAEFWKNVAVIIKEKKIQLPANRIRLQEKIAKYKAEGYQCLVVDEFRFNNTNRAKVKDELAKSVLLDMISNGKQHDDIVILRKYNAWAKLTGREEIKSETTIGNYRRENEWSIKEEREGRKASHDKLGIVINRKRPSAPMLLLNSDDNELDLFFRYTYIKNGKEVTTPYKRYVVMVVIDAYNDYILGYAVGDAQTQELVKEAYLNAMYHIRDLTGGWYLPHQVQTDRWGVNKDLNNGLAMFYKGLGIYTPAKQYNARSKYIERSFGTEWHQSLKMYPNYAGHNITADERLNPDLVALNKSTYPTAEQAPMQIAHFIETMRQAKDRQKNWLAAFNASDKAKEKRVGDEYILAHFGKPHDYKHSITSEGIVIAINKVEYTYMVPEELYLHNVGKKVQVYYQEHDLSRVLVTDEHTLRFVAQEKHLQPSALADYQPGDRERLNALLAMGQRNMQKVADARNKRKKILQDNGIDTENLLLEGGIYAKSVLQSGNLDKTIKQNVTQKYIEQQYGESKDSKEFDPYDLI